MKVPKIALVHEWFVDHSGSEKVVEQIIDIFPDAQLNALIDFLPDRKFIKHKPVTTSFIQRLPFAKKHYRNYLPFMPLAIEQLDVSLSDIVISSSHAFSKGVITSADQLNICYCHSPIRYGWDLYHQYLKESKLDRGFKGFIAKLVLHYIRMWDLSTSNRIDHFIANSKYVARRINKIYNKQAHVIYPPVDTDAFTIGSEIRGDFYLTASRLVPYKKVDIIVEAFQKMPDKRLVVIGDGPDLKKIKTLSGNNIEILGYQSFEELKRYMQTAKAFIFAADEDFGISPVEAQACGTPVIAYGKGGSLETVKADITGFFFYEQNSQSVIDLVKAVDDQLPRLDHKEIRRHAENFSIERFKKEFKTFVDERYSEFLVSKC